MINKKMVLFGIILYGATFISGCGQLWNASIGGEKIVDRELRDYEDLIQHEITDTDRDIDYTDSVPINISQPISQYEGIEGCILESENMVNSITICKEGNYIISGTSNEFRLIIDVYDDEIVHLFLDGVEWKTKGGPAIYVKQAGKMVITLMDGTENIISDGAEYSSDAEACIFSNSDLTINGDGKLSVYGYYHDALRSKDRLKVINSNLYIKTQNDGIRGNDGIVSENCTLQIEGKGSGLRTDSEKGYVLISGGNCKIIAGENAITADDYVGIFDCDYTFSSVYEAVHCNGIKELDEKNIK